MLKVAILWKGVLEMEIFEVGIMQVDKVEAEDLEMEIL